MVPGTQALLLSARHFLCLFLTLIPQGLVEAIGYMAADRHVDVMMEEFVLDGLDLCLISTSALKLEQTLDSPRALVKTQVAACECLIQ